MLASTISCMMGSGRRGRPTIFLHIGLPKTGTTYIQGTLWARKEELLDAGVLCPGESEHDHFAAAIDLRGDYGYRLGIGDHAQRTAAVGSWPRLVDAAKSADRSVVISHELFSTVGEERARKALAELSDTDLHIIVTARDPARQIVSAWQQRIKQGSTKDFSRVAERLSSTAQLHGAQDLPQTLDRWAAGIPAEQVHVVTVPPPESPRNILWTRFADAIGVDPAQIESADEARANEALGVAETELLRRINVALDGRIPQPTYGQVVARRYAQGILSAHVTSRKAVLPQLLAPAAETLADQWITHLSQRGYRVHGDLTDLRPQLMSSRGPDAASESEIAEAAVAATAQFLVEVAERSARRRTSRRSHHESPIDAAIEHESPIAGTTE
jgi:hypothetical protein